MSAVGARVQQLREKHGIGTYEASRIAWAEHVRAQLNAAQDVTDLKDVLDTLINVVLDLPREP